MGNNTSRILIETIVKNTLRDIKDSPERSTRNLVDMALHFSEGRFQRDFFKVAQTMLKNDNSPYYYLIQDTVQNVNTEKLLQFGMNLGYNSCTVGAKKIREIEEKEQYNIPWIISFHLCTQQFLHNQESYHSVISDGESLGIHAWMLSVPSLPHEVLPLIQDHPDSAFALFCTPQEITMSFLETASDINNLMLVIQYEDDIADVCNQLREMGLLYSIYYPYTQDDIDLITSGDLFCSIEQLHPVATMLVAVPGCPVDVKQEIYEYAKQAREQQLFHTIIWETTYDSITVDNIISSESCLAGFDSSGQLITLQGYKESDYFNCMKNSLENILKQAFPKKL